jgi:tRNA-2-methylthio-N6-dimethylallyladenosine synthase
MQVTDPSSPSGLSETSSIEGLQAAWPVLQGSGKKVHVETWGCQMNVADSEQMLAMLKQQNYATAATIEDADLIILNTCHIREKAVHKVVSRLGTLKALKKEKPTLQIAVSGCVPQMEHKRIAKSAPHVDIMFGPGQIQQLPKLLEDNRVSQKLSTAFGFKTATLPETQVIPGSLPVSSERPILDGKNTISRFLNIAQGCDNFCTFCVVPFTRGREVSLSPETLISEARSLLASGAKEIVLLGQNVNSYGLDLVRDGHLTVTTAGPFVELLRAMETLPGLERLRFTTSNPHDFTEELAKHFLASKKLGRYLHLPVQSGSNEVLEAMKRKVTVEEYLNKIQLLRELMPDMALSTDLIVGFPGETDEDFQQTLHLMEQVRFHFVYAFSYSPRRGTAAARFSQQVPEEIKTQRLAALNATQARISQQLHEEALGQEVEVLFHYPSPKELNVYHGRDPYFRLVKVESARSLVGQKAQVRIVAASRTSLVAQLL